MSGFRGIFNGPTWLKHGEKSAGCFHFTNGFRQWRTVKIQVNLIFFGKVSQPDQHPNACSPAEISSCSLRMDELKYSKVQCKLLVPQNVLPSAPRQRQPPF